MCKRKFIERQIVATLIITSCATFAGCQTSAGPWRRRAYQRPSHETPVNEVVVTPGVALPFQQRLPAGNLNTFPDAAHEPNAEN